MTLFFLLFLYFSLVKILQATAQCPPDGKWILKRFDNSFYCYTTLELGSNVNGQEVLKNDICKQKAHPSSRVASIHSNAENDFLMNNFYGSMIGFFIPKNVKWAPNNFRWSDGSAVNFVGWDILGIPKQPDNQIPKERFVKLRKKWKSKGWHDYQFKEMKKVLCKMNALESLPATIPSTTKASTATVTATPTTTLKLTDTPATTSTKDVSSTTAASTTTTTLKTTTTETEASSPTTTTSSTTISTSTSSISSTASTTTHTSSESSIIQSTTTPLPSTTLSSTIPSTTETPPTATTSIDDGGIVILDGAQA